jgi:Zn-finger nucleic acid-binding protein
MARQATAAYYRFKTSHNALVEAQRESRKRLQTALAAEEQRIVEEISSQLGHADTPASDRSCPACGKQFVLVRVQTVDLDACRECGSLWFDAGEFKTLTRALRDLADEAACPAPSQYKCPVCLIPMVQRPLLPGKDLIVDQCPAGHGFFLEHNELRRALDLTFRT